MRLAQLCEFLREYRGADYSERAREALLEWALSHDAETNISDAARLALSALPAGGASPALAVFRGFLELAAQGLPDPRRRGGAAGRRARLAAAA